MFIEFLTNYLGCTTEDSIPYRIVEYKKYIEFMTVKEANKKMTEDYNRFVYGWGLEEENAYEGTIWMWKKHLVIL